MDVGHIRMAVFVLGTITSSTTDAHLNFVSNGDRKQPQFVYGQNSEVKHSHVPNLHDNIASLVYKNQRIRKRIFIKNTTPSRAFTNSDDLVKV